MPTKEMRHRPSERGFSLMELLLVMFLAPIVFMAVYANFSTGVKLWQRLQVETPEEDQAIFLIKTRRDIEAALRYSPIPFEGDGDQMQFASGIDEAQAPGGARAMGRVRYYYDERAGGLMRRVWDLSELYREKDGKTERILKGVRSFKILYLVKEVDSPEYGWQEEFHPEKPSDLPLAVRFSYSSVWGNAENTFFIPAGGAIK